MNKGISLLLLFSLFISTTHSYQGQFGPIRPEELRILSLGLDPLCKRGKDYQEKDIPTIFIPGILASWYSEEGYGESTVKRWIPDPITHSYDTLFYTFSQNGYSLKDVFYQDEYTLSIDQDENTGNPKKSLYLFGYDWKKDNKITATLLNQLISKITQQYLQLHGCEINEINLIGHSMGGLVARAMLQDMCVDDEALKTYRENTTPVQGNIPSFASTPCKHKTKINQFITISTPHRGSPKSLPMWEKGDIDRVESYFTAALPLLLQLQLDSNQGLYETIHGYNPDIPKGIVTIGQLLPDIQNPTPNNETLKYLYKKSPPPNQSPTLTPPKDKYYLSNHHYPKNTFLEELNHQSNIEKMWNKIKGQYTSYYSTLTGNKDKNNILEYRLSKDTKRDCYYNGYEYKCNTPYIVDNTRNILGKDIYDPYPSTPPLKNYLIQTTIRDQHGKGGDGTVPTNNLKLTPNDIDTPQEITHPKFQSVEIKCYDEALKKEHGLSDLGEIETFLYKNIGKKKVTILGNQELSACSHTKTPIAAAIQVYNQISGAKLFSNILDKNKPRFERNLLLEYIGNADYTEEKIYRNVLPYGTGILSVGISNDTQLDTLFENQYSTVLDQEEREKDKKIVNPEDIEELTHVPLSFGLPTAPLRKVFRYDILSPINLIITDEHGRSIGIDPETGKIINEIPGAWTSGNTEGSGEPEFFLIPITGTGANHTIRTYGTGDGSYQIVMNEIESIQNPPLLWRRGAGGEVYSGEAEEEVSLHQSRHETPTPKTFTITGTAKTHFGEDYEVEITQEAAEYVNLTETTPPTLELSLPPSPPPVPHSGKERAGVRSLTTDQDTLNIKYTIRGNSDNIVKIQHTLIPPLLQGEGARGGGHLEPQIHSTPINGTLPVPLPSLGTYTLTLQLLDQNNQALNNPESKQTIQIIKTKQAPTIKEVIHNNNSNTHHQNSPSFRIKGKGLGDGLFTLQYPNTLPFQIHTTPIQNGPLGYQLTHNYDTPENQPEHLEYIYTKNDRGEDILDHVTDNKTNTLFLSYQNDLLSQIHDLHDNTITFEYTHQENTPFLTKIRTHSQNHHQTTTITYDHNLTHSISHTTIDLPLTSPKPPDHINSFHPSPQHSYTTLRNHIYQIHPKTHQRTHLFSLPTQSTHTQTHPTTSITHLFATPQGTIYLTDQNHQLWKYEHKKLFSYDTTIPGKFVVSKEKLFGIHPFQKQHITYDFSTQEKKRFKSRKFYQDITLTPQGEVRYSEEKNENHYEEFAKKYEKKLKKLQERIESKYDPGTKKKVRHILQRQKTPFLKKIKNEYHRVEIQYLIDAILQMLG